MRDSKKMKEQKSLDPEGQSHSEVNKSKGQSIEGDNKVSSNLRNRSRLYWLFSCCGSSINIQNIQRENSSSEESD